MKREKSTEQRLRCPVLFSHAWGEVPPGGREGEVARPLGLSRRGCGGAKSGGGNAKILLPETEAQGLAGSKERRPPGARRGEIRRRECEDFAPRNGGTRPSGKRGAKRGGRRECGGAKSGGENVKILLPETEAQGLTGSGEQREEAAGRAEGRKPVAGM